MHPLGARGRALAGPIARLLGCGLLALGLAASASGPARPAIADEGGLDALAPYRVTELVVRRGPGQQSDPVLSGPRAYWREADPAQPTPRIRGRDLATGEDLQIGDLPGLSSFDLDGDRLVAVGLDSAGQYTVALYHLPDGARTVLAATRDRARAPSQVRLAGDVVVWAQGSATADIFAYALRTGQVTQLTGQPARRESPAVSGDLVVWLDRRNAPAGSGDADVYGYDLAGQREFRITAQPGPIGAPAISGGIVVWPSWGAGGGQVLGYDFAAAAPITVAALPAGAATPPSVAVSGDIVVWSARGTADQDIFGYDLRLGRAFVVSRAIGDQERPRISGHTVVWTDGRASGVGEYEADLDVFGATLEPGPAAAPAVVGAPESADARIEIVWPHGGAPVSQASLANVAAWLFLPGTLDLAPCQWSPRVQLWQSLNGAPARLVATGARAGGRYYSPDRRAIPTWEFDDVDVGAARDPRNTLYYFVALDGVAGRSSVWAHGSDARTYFPRQDVPTGVGPLGDAVEARIEIVWPHGGVPVEQARLVNVAAMLFRPGTLVSVPPEWDRGVRLYRSLNSGVGEPVALGTRRLVQGRGFTYPVWEFDDVDVSAAVDPTARYYFTLAVDGTPTLTSVWAHGADGRTHFPAMDVPTAPCR